MNDKNKLLELLKLIKLNKIHNEMQLILINDDLELIKKCVLYDDNNTCFYGYNTIDELVSILNISSNNYGIYYNDELIGMISSFYEYYKDLTRLELSMIINKDYRNNGFGLAAIKQILDLYFNNSDIKCVHLSISRKNTSSNALAEKAGFIKYRGYKCNDFFIDKDSRRIEQNQYLLTKKEYLKTTSY